MAHVGRFEAMPTPFQWEDAAALVRLVDRAALASELSTLAALADAHLREAETTGHWRGSARDLLLRLVAEHHRWRRTRKAALPPRTEFLLDGLCETLRQRLVALDAAGRDEIVSLLKHNPPFKQRGSRPRHRGANSSAAANASPSRRFAARPGSAMSTDPAPHPDPGGPLRDPARLAALRRTGLLDTPPEAVFDRLTRLVCRLLGVPVALVSLVDAERQFFKSAVGLPAPWALRRETPLSHSFCQHVVATGAPLIVQDATRHPLVCDNLAIADLGVVAYLGMPLATADGHVLGSLCGIDTQPRAWTAEHAAALHDLAVLVMSELALRSLARYLAARAR